MITIPNDPTTVVLIAALIQSQFDLPDGRGTIYNEPFKMPEDDGLCYSVAVIADKPYGTSKRHEEDPVDGLVEVSGTNVQELVQVMLYSKGYAALERRHELTAALNSDEAERLQAQYAFQLSRIPSSFVDISQNDGARRLYRFAITFNVLRAYTRKRLVESFNRPDGPTLIIQP